MHDPVIAVCTQRSPLKASSYSFWFLGVVKTSCSFSVMLMSCPRTGNNPCYIRRRLLPCNNVLKTVHILRFCRRHHFPGSCLRVHQLRRAYALEPWYGHQRQRAAVSPCLLKRASKSGLGPPASAPSRKTTPAPNLSPLRLALAMDRGAPPNRRFRCPLAASCEAWRDCTRISPWVETSCTAQDMQHGAPTKQPAPSATTQSTGAARSWVAPLVRVLSGIIRSIAPLT